MALNLALCVCLRNYKETRTLSSVLFRAQGSQDTIERDQLRQTLIVLLLKRLVFINPKNGPLSPPLWLTPWLLLYGLYSALLG